MAMFALTGCVTGPYQQFSDGVGYKSELEKDNIYRVSYTGTQSTGYNKLNDLVFLRSAELAIEKGYDYFIITKASNNRTQITSAMGAGISGVPAHRRVAGLTNKVRPESNLVIKLFKF
ncbi:MAG: hypothetical protein HOM01_07035, partial [Kordiimonadaceae bacterium]|nr:hypothetical protein [Kordiimonadaceae bacterium]